MTLHLLRARLPHGHAVRLAACAAVLCLAAPRAARAAEADASSQSAEGADQEETASGPALIGGRPDANVFATVLAATAASATAGLGGELGLAAIEKASLPAVVPTADVPVTVNPEPSTVVLLAGGTAVLAGVARRRARQGAR